MTIPSCDVDRDTLCPQMHTYFHEIDATGFKSKYIGPHIFSAVLCCPCWRPNLNIFRYNFVSLLDETVAAWLTIPSPLPVARPSPPAVELLLEHNTGSQSSGSAETAPLSPTSLIALRQPPAGLPRGAPVSSSSWLVQRLPDPQSDAIFFGPLSMEVGPMCME